MTLEECTNVGLQLIYFFNNMGMDGLELMQNWAVEVCIYLIINSLVMIDIITEDDGVWFVNLLAFYIYN